MKKIIIALMFALLLSGCASQAAPETGEENVTEPAAPEEEPEELATVTAEELTNHENVFSCWVVYEGKVYDITSYLPNHANGSIEGILPTCGLADDSFANAFKDQHGTSKVSVLETEGILMGRLAEE